VDYLICRVFGQNLARSKFANLEHLEGQLHNLVAGVDVDDPNFFGSEKLFEFGFLLTAHPGKAGFNASHSVALILLPLARARPAAGAGRIKDVSFVYEARDVCKLSVVQHGKYRAVFNDH